MKTHTQPILFLLLASTLSFGACGDDPATGTLELAVYGEDFVEEGIPSDVFADSWSLTFDRFEVSISQVSAATGHDANALSLEGPVVYDLTVASAGEGQLVLSGEVDGGAYDHIAYRVDSIDLAGSATKGDVTKSFSWLLDTPTYYSECEGTAFVDGTVERTQLTLHADHLFYDDLVSEDPNLAFDLIAAADEAGDANGEVTAEELAAVDITGEERYQVGNATEVTDLWSFIDRQSSTVGHIDGEGHCGQAERQ